MPTPADPAEEHLENVRAMLAEVYDRSGRNSNGVENHTPLDDLLRAEEGELPEHYDAGVVMLNRFLGWVFERGPDPAAALQRLFVVARALAPALILNMSGDEVGVIFGQGRAAESARIVLLNKKLKSAGFKHTTFRPQKSVTARAKMSKAQRGNRNRKGHRATVENLPPQSVPRRAAESRVA